METTCRASPLYGLPGMQRPRAGNVGLQQVLGRANAFYTVNFTRRKTAISRWSHNQAQLPIHEPVLAPLAA
jgi:hypothetical protein